MTECFHCIPTVIMVSAPSPPLPPHCLRKVFCARNMNGELAYTQNDNLQETR